MKKQSKILTLTVTYPYMCDGEPCTASRLNTFTDNLKNYLEDLSTTGTFNWKTFTDTHLSTLVEFVMSPVQTSIYYSFREYRFKMRKINPI